MLFTVRTLVWLGSIGTATFLLGILVGVYSDQTIISAGNDGFSRSALGHQALVRVLEELQIPVSVSRFDSVRRARGGLLVVAEPRLEFSSTRADMLEEYLDHGEATLIVLPRRRAPQDPARPGWVHEADEQSTAGIEEALGFVVPGLTVHRLAEAPSGGWQAPDFETRPTTLRPQLMRSDELLPLIECPDGILLGKILGMDTWVLADPDLFATHGLQTDGQLAIEIIERLRPPGGPVVIDEVLHGYAAVHGLWREIFRFPMVLLVIQVVLVFVLLVLATAWRFGAPRSGLDEGIAAGKSKLLDSTAQLLASGGHAAYSVVRYHAAHVQDVAESLNLSGASDERHDRLRVVSRLRAVEPLFDEMEQSMAALNPVKRGQPAVALRAARAVAHWRQGMLRETTAPGEGARRG